MKKLEREMPENTQSQQNTLESDSLHIEYLEKHAHYKNSYTKNTVYWGLGIENESYLEFDSLRIVDSQFMIKNHKRERYCIDYVKNYKNNVFYDSIVRIFHNKNKNYLSILMNAHSFLKCDKYGNHSMIYHKNEYIPNSTYNGLNLFEELQKTEPYFREQHGKSFVFDGDTIEFITQNFLNSNINDTILELSHIEHTFITKLRSALKTLNYMPDLGNIQICTKNHPFAIFLTNMNHYTIFNNMTYHFNITIPTKLNEQCEIDDKRLFIEQHRNAIRVIQWLEPILIAKFGAPDYLSLHDKNVNLTKCSQRCAISRYISIGSYNTDKMNPGKILQIELSEHPMNTSPIWWFNRYYQMCGYQKLDKIGLDINFHKHLNHGIELRFFDYFPECHLREVLQFIVLALDLSLDKPDIINPIYQFEWNDLVYNTILYGKDAIITKNILSVYASVLNIPSLLSIDKPITPVDLYDIIYKHLHDTYRTTGLCSTKMISQDTIEIYTPVSSESVPAAASSQSHKVKNATTQTENIDQNNAEKKPGFFRRLFSRKKKPSQIVQPNVAIDINQNDPIDEKMRKKIVFI